MEMMKEKDILLSECRNSGTSWTRNPFFEENGYVIIKNLYETNFFKDISLSIDDNTLSISVVENKIIQSVIIEGVKSQRIQKAILKNLFSKTLSY